MANNNLMGGYKEIYGDKVAELAGKVDSYGGYSYGKQDAYDRLIDSAANREAFRYDASQDPAAAAYKKQYLREGERASANALAQASAASGGRPSSYAVAAANQAGNYYAGQLADKLPELEQNAYQRYLSEQQMNLNALNALQTDRQTGYNEWLDSYNMLQNSLGNYQNMEATGYQRYLDQIANAMGLYGTLGYATDEVRQILGIPAPAVSYGGGGPSYAGSGGTGQTADAATDPEVQSYLAGLGQVTSQQKYSDLAQLFGADTLAGYGITRPTGGLSGGAPVNKPAQMIK